MPTATSISGWGLVNSGPLTTTWTAPATCSSNDHDMYYGQLTTIDGSSILVDLYRQCSTTAPRPTSCSPPGPNQEDVDGWAVYYYSPGLVCPAGWATVAEATKFDGGSITSSGMPFTWPGAPSPVPSGLINNLVDYGPNVMLAGMGDGETAVLCCPRYFEFEYFVMIRQTGIYSRVINETLTRLQLLHGQCCGLLLFCHIFVSSYRWMQVHRT